MPKFTNATAAPAAPVNPTTTTTGAYCNTYAAATMHACMVYRSFGNMMLFDDDSSASVDDNDEILSRRAVSFVDCPVRSYINQA
jgi:hypothetical protein